MRWILIKCSSPNYFNNSFKNKTCKCFLKPVYSKMIMKVKIMDHPYNQCWKWLINAIKLRKKKYYHNHLEYSKKNKIRYIQTN